MQRKKSKKQNEYERIDTRQEPGYQIQVTFGDEEPQERRQAMDTGDEYTEKQLEASFLT